MAGSGADGWKEAPLPLHTVPGTVMEGDGATNVTPFPDSPPIY